VSIRNLRRLLQPRSIALVGASEAPASVGRKLFENLLAAGFDGPVYPVNPRQPRILDRPAFARVEALPSPVDLAVIATPAATVPGIVAALGAVGTRAAVVVSAGFAESQDGSGAALQRAMLEAARPHLLRIIGPNCVGILVPGARLNASFAHAAARPGDVAFVTQSGAVLTAVLDWANERGIGFSHLLSLGAMADVDFGDVLDHLANDAGTRAILLYVEAITHARKFMSAARAAARSKPVIVCKAGRHEASARAARSHSGALAGADAVYDAAFRRAGLVRVFTLEDLFDAVESLALGRRAAGSRLAIVTNGGGIGILATDRLLDLGGRLAELSPASLAALDAALPAAWSHGNPVDIVGDAGASRYRAALEAVLPDPGVDAVLALNCPVALLDGIDAARVVVDLHAQFRAKPLFASWVGGAAQAASRQFFAQHGVPHYDTPEDAVRAFMVGVEYGEAQQALLETPASLPSDFTPDVAAARRIVEAALAQDRVWLAPLPARALLAAYGIPVLEAVICPTAAAAAEATARLGCPVALKIDSRNIPHKTDVGGVVLDLAGADAVRAAADAMAARVRAALPQARIDGFTVEPMRARTHAFELLVGAHEDAQFGPVLVFGQGGTAVEIVADTAVGLPPLNLALARQLIGRTRIARLLGGYRSLPGADQRAIALTLVRVAQMLVDVPGIVELDINPLVADANGVVALDARVRVARPTEPGTRRLAIRPYPSELEEELVQRDGRTLLLRPIRPEDEPALQAAFAKLTPEEVRMRFFSAMRSIDHVTAARFTQIDYDREMALVLTVPGAAGRAEILGVVRLHEDPDRERAEYAILVLRAMTNRGLGRLMMERIIVYARRRGIGTLHGTVLRENRRMLALCRALGFAIAADPEDRSVVTTTLALRSCGLDCSAPHGR
jgi:acetyltransferase